MKIKNKQNESVSLFQKCVEMIAEKVRTKARPFFLSLVLGVLLSFARRRTVTQWIRAGQISDRFRLVFYHMPRIGRKGGDLFDAMLEMILETLATVIATAAEIRLVLDDSPTKRYGKKIEGAGFHHNPTPGRTNAKTCFGHSWVVAVLVVTHPMFGEISFPVAAELYLRKKEIDKLRKKYSRQFKTKTAMAVAMIERLVPKFARFGKPVSIIVDGGYAKDTVLVPLGKLENVTVITRLRRDAALFEIPPARKPGQRGRPRMYGERIDIKSMLASKNGWQTIECRLYGQVVKKTIKTFTATSRLTKGKPLQVVLVKEDTTTWVPLMSTNPDASAKEILESYGVRFGIEETFKDLKEVWGWGKQEVRLLESNEAATTLNMLLYSLTELATWDLPAADLVDRRDAPWDDPDRRPSHADRRNFLRRGVLADELNAALQSQPMTEKIKNVLEKLMLLAA